MADPYLGTGCEGLTAEPAVQFWAYDNHHRDRARVHRGDCSHCNNGQGTQGGSSGDNDTWRGPFGSPAEAYAKVAGRADVAYCSFCLPDGG